MAVSATSRPLSPIRCRTAAGRRRRRSVDVGGQQRAERQRGDEQDARGGVLVGHAAAREALAQRPRSRARPRAPPAAARSPTAERPRARERRGADGVGEEREPPQHDPGAEDAREHGEQPHLHERALHVGGREAVEHGLTDSARGRRRGAADDRVGVGLPASRCRSRRTSPSGRASPPIARGRRGRRPRARSRARRRRRTELSANTAGTCSRRIVRTSAAVSPAEAWPRVEREGITVAITSRS